MGSLDDLRKNIDRVDRELVELLTERLQLATDIGKAKQAGGRAFFDPVRERKVLDKVRELAGSRYPTERLESIYREIISATRTAQAGETVLVHGAPGSLAHEAAHQRFGGGSIYEWTAREADVFARLGEGDCDFAVVALEGRSLELSVDRLDAFLQTEAQVFAEIWTSPRYGLHAPTEVDVWDDRPIFATASALASVSRWLEGQAGRRDVHVVGTAWDAAAACRDLGGVILGPPVVSRLPGFKTVAEGLEDEPEAVRRYFVLSKQPAPPSGKDQTLLLVVLANRYGSLHAVTDVLLQESVNISWIEPKSTHLGSWDHIFLIELDGHREDASVMRAVERLAGCTEVMRVLGSFSRDRG